MTISPALFIGHGSPINTLELNGYGLDARFKLLEEPGFAARLPQGIPREQTNI